MKALTSRQQTVLAEVHGAGGRKVIWSKDAWMGKALDALQAAGLVRVKVATFTVGSSRGIKYESRYTVEVR